MTLRLGIAGAGFIAAVYCHAARQVSGIEIAAVASPRSAAGFAARWGIPRVYDDPAAMAAEAPIDAVLVALPNHLHREVTLAAAAAGRHVLCEKPLAAGIPDARAMVEACEAAGVVLALAENLLFAPLYERTRRLASDGHVGQPFLVKCSQAHGGPYSDWFFDPRRAGGGALVDMGPHTIHTICRLLGAWPEAVTARLARYLHAARTPAEDHAHLLLHFPRGVLGIAEASWAVPGGNDTLEVYGPGGRLLANLERGPAVAVYRQPPGEDVQGGWQHIMYEEAWQFGFPAVLRDFAGAAAGLHPPRADGRDGLRVLEIIAAAYESDRLGATVRLPLARACERLIDHWRQPD